MLANAFIRATIAVASLASVASAQVTFSTNRATWVASMGGDRQVAAWQFFDQMLVASNELNSIPAPNTDLGSVLTFSTPIPFKLRCMQPGATLVFRDSLLSSGIESLLSIGNHHIIAGCRYGVSAPVTRCMPQIVARGAGPSHGRQQSARLEEITPEPSWPPRRPATLPSTRERTDSPKQTTEVNLHHEALLPLNPGLSAAPRRGGGTSLSGHGDFTKTRTIYSVRCCVS